jgi:hypothetical protein
MKAVAGQVAVAPKSVAPVDQRSRSAGHTVSAAPLNPLWQRLATRVGERPGPARPPAARPVASLTQGFGIQRRCEACAQESADDERLRVQAKLSIGPADDLFEREADAVAERVMGIPEGPQTAAPPEGGGTRSARMGLDLSRRPVASIAAGRVQRDPQADTEEEQAQDAERESVVQRAPVMTAADAGADEDDADELDATVQPKAENGRAGADASGIESRILGLRGTGQPLPDASRSFFETRFGHDFGQVRVHHGDTAAQTAHALGARAYTLGHDVVFGAGQYAPDRAEGRRLIAHELTHVVQQGAAPPARTAGGSLQAQFLPRIGARGAPGLVQRAPLKEGGTYLIQTPKGGNLRLRVQPSHALDLKGRDTCGGQADTCPNSVGNVASGTKVVIKEVRLFDWYVVEAPMVEGGTRIGFVHQDHLKEVPPPPAGSAAAPSAAVPAAPEPPIPVEEPDTPVFETGTATIETMEEGAPVEQLGVVQTEDGTKLWPAANRDQPELGLLPLNTRVFVDRNLTGGWSSVYVDRHQQGSSLPVGEGTHGYVATGRVSTDMPDPDARLHRITQEGQGALALAGELYPNYNVQCAAVAFACRDYRYLVNVLVAVNEAKGRKFIYKEHPDDAWDKAKTMKASKSGAGAVGGQIWVPGMALVKALEGQVSSGSISLAILSTLADVTIGVAAFIVGLLHGAVMSVVDVLIGLVDLVKLVVSLVEKLINGTLLADAKAFWEDISNIKLSDIKEMISAKWNHANTWDRWHFRGYAIGYAIVEILMLIFSGGAATAVKWAGKVGKFGKLGEYLGKLPKVAKLIESAKALKGEGVAKLRTALKGALALSESHVWAAQVLRIPLGILKLLEKAQIDELKKLPQWLKERFARLSEAVMKRLLRCSSPCQVDVHKIAEALKLAGKGGTVLNDAADVLRVLKVLAPNLKTAKISRKLRKADSALMTVIKEAKLTDTDFAKLADYLENVESPAQAYKTFVRYLSSVVPAKTGPDIKSLNAILSKMMAAERGRGAALKGPMFEQWVALHVPQLSSRTFSRTTFDVKKLLGKKSPPFKRQVDTWVPDKGEIWDMKHRFGKVDPDQAADYSKLIGQAAPDGKAVQTINYLFPNQTAAELNRHLRTTYKFGVYYIDEATNTMKLLP